MRIAMIGLRGIVEGVSGGIERHVRELAIRMVGLGHQVSVICRPRYETYPEPEYLGVRLIHRPAIYSKHLEAISNTALGMPAAIAAADLVHVHATGPSLLSWMPRLAGRASVVTVHGLDFQRAKWGGVASLVLRVGAWTSVHCPNRTIVVSGDLKQHYAEHYGQDTVHIPNGITEPVRRPLDGLQRFGLEKNGYILALGRLVPEKGFHYLIEAFRRIETSLKLVIAGPSSHSDEYLTRLKTLAGDDPRILFVGPLFGNDKDEAFSSAKLFVLPSDLEGMPIVLLEAMAYGCPVLTSDIPPCIETFNDGEAYPPLTGRLGYRFQAGNVDSLSSSLSVMLARDDLAGMGLRARTFALGRYDWDTITSQTIEVYQSALN
ncbi:MAG: glycosyltransferase family 4 protein [Proteobacteria bacterium]|nr:glycosyltransferase family 4 protein [Pseudomonadota bacterium]MBU1611646.1 glycosyltransferase family 4 protein [Pseudomonadota bacterium]